MLALVGRTFALLRRRWPLYLIGVSAAIVAQTAIIVALRRPTLAEPIANSLILPMLVTIVYAFADADLRETGEAQKDLWSRVLERVWAVIIIQLIDTIAGSWALEFAGAPGVTGFLMATLLDFVLAAFIFADVIATVGDEGNPLWVIQHSIGRSIWTILHGRGNLLRAVTLVVIGFAFEFASQGLGVELGAFHVPYAEFWAAIPFQTLAQLPLAALTVVFYRACVEASNATDRKD